MSFTHVEANMVKSFIGRTTSGISIWFESMGDPAAPAVLLIMGQGGQSMSWDDEFCDFIIDGGYRVIRFDNRDAGLSGEPDNRYLLKDMALDALGVLDELDVPAAHLVGQSMGGMIAQEIAIHNQDRVASLSLLSTSPDISIAPPDPRIARVASDLEAVDEREWIESAIESIRIQTGSLWQFDEQVVRDRIETAVKRAFRPDGANRQVGAILASPARTESLSAVTAPTIVIHGDEDPILPVEHARVLAHAIPNARLHIVEGMGHAVPWGHWDVIIPLLLRHLDFAGDGVAR